ncbi:hypothetical protein A9Z42_0044850 [Trichoderma parareesei]|uniref:Uncharacterized protein n=1 Tax=Trichoderma parareesei TaxID=858221 RepID=A0A2H2Z991_TRIPA|nr:hypothetical protein A9Z42_0044850 [Trichoderma parareesei]
MAQDAPTTSTSQHPPPPPLESTVVDSQPLSTRIITDPNTSDAVSRKKLKTSKSAEQSNAAGPRDRPSQPLTQPAPLRRSDLPPPPPPPPYNIDRRLLGQGAPGLVGATTTTTIPNNNGGMQRQQQQQAGGQSSDRRDWAQPGVVGKDSLGRGPWLAPSTSGGIAPSAAPKPPLLTQHAPGVKTAMVDDQNITSLTRDKGSKRGIKRRLSVGQAEAEFDQKRLLNIVQDLDKLEKEQKDFGQQQLQAIRETSV